MFIQMNSSGNPQARDSTLLRAGWPPGCLYRIAGIHYSERTMWNIEERFSPKAIESLAALGFAVGSTRGVVRVEKYGCGAEFRKGTDELYQMTIPPTIMLRASSRGCGTPVTRSFCSLTKG
jgi:hypothetical protein